MCPRPFKRNLKSVDAIMQVGQWADPPDAVHVTFDVDCKHEVLTDKVCILVAKHLDSSMQLCGAPCACIRWIWALCLGLLMLLGLICIISTKPSYKRVSNRYFRDQRGHGGLCHELVC